MKWKKIAEDLYLALHELDRLTADGTCNCDQGYLCVNCRVAIALACYKGKSAEQEKIKEIRKMNNGKIKHTP